MKGFRNANVYVYNKGIIKTNLGIEDGKIAYIGEDEKVITECFPYKEEQVVVPAFIDEHIHGAGGADAMDGSVEALKIIANAISSEGTASFLATTMTQSKENILKAMHAVKNYKEQNFLDGAEILGVHLEGPFISEKHIGAQPLEYVAKPDIKTFDEYNDASANSIKIVSLSPEVEGARELISHLNKKGIIASVGHSDAGFNDIERAIDLGLKNVTHTFNAQKPLHHRDIGTVGSAMYFDSLNAEAICDLIHLSMPAIKLLIKNKPHDKFTLITDSMRAKHLGEGISELGGQKVIVKNGEARLENGALAGSILKMNDAIKNLVLKCDVPFTSAIDFATVNPAKNLNIFDSTGSIELLKRANLTVLDGEFNVHLTIRDGNVIYKA
jgi:N-acetylglucosamine-6-phosphate deacetylase